jgi:hypothetical protein
VVTDPKEKHMSTTKQQRLAAFARSRSGARSSGGGETPETMADLAVAVGAASASDRDAWRDRFASDFAGTRAAMWAAHAAAVAVTPATPATARSRASVAAGSGVPAVTYPSAWSRAVSAAQRITGSRKAQPAKSAWPTVTPSAHVAGTTAPASGGTDGFYDKSVKPSAFAASQEQARQADLSRMAAEQSARFGA